MQFQQLNKLLLAFDLVSLTLAWHLTIYVRVLLNPFFPRQFLYEELVQVAPPIIVLLALWTFVWLWLQLGQKQEVALGTTLLRVAEATVLAGFVAIAVTFFSQNFGSELSRSHVVLFLPISFITLIVGQYLCLLTIKLIDRTWPGAERVAFIGDTFSARAAAERMRSTPRVSFSVVGVILSEQAHAGMEADEEVPILGTITRLAEVINEGRLTQLFLVGDSLRGSELDNCVNVSARMGVTLSQIIATTAPQVKIRISDLGNLRLMEMRPIAFTRSQEIAKRSFDIICTSALLLLLAPLLAAVAALIKISSPGPVLYISTRVGKGGRHFTFYKFRTMYHGSDDRGWLADKNEKSGHIFKMRNDPRVTPIGAWLRRCSIDELAQLFNVLRGDMSLVGPRPLPAKDLEPDGQSREFAAWADQRSRVLPGITGLWQINGRSDLPFHRMVELDLMYVETWSLRRDVRILLETPLVLVTGRGAY